MSDTAGKCIYVPVLRGREGEFSAYETLSPDLKQFLTPLIELPSIPFDYAQNRPQRTLSEHLSTLLNRVAQAYKGNHLYLDFKWLEGGDYGGVKQTGFRQLIDSDLLAIPVFARQEGPEDLRAAKEIVQKLEGSIAIRLGVEDFSEDLDLDQDLDRILAGTSAEISRTDLIIDLQDLGSDLGRASLLARSIFSLVPYKDRWRRLILVASSFPEDLSEVGASSVQRLPRLEWDLWTRLQRKPSALPTPNLIYGDYAISSSTPREVDPRTMRMSANIRYSTFDHWLIVKGRNVRQYGFEQYFELCRTLIEQPDFSGRIFSSGDRYISDCAEGQAGPGNATTWRKVGVNHHLTLMVNQLSN